MATYTGTNVATFTPVKLEPYMDPQSARTLALQFVPSQTLARGTVIGQRSSDGKALAFANPGTSDVQTLTVTGTPAGGTFTLSLARAGVTATTSAIAYNATAAAVQAALEALVNVGPGRVAVTGGPGPGTPWVVTFDLNEDVPTLTHTDSLTGGSSPAVGVAATTAGVAATAGNETPKGFLVYDIVVDASGNIVYGPSGAAADLTRGYDITAPIYWKGTFLQSDLTGLDAAAIAALGGRVQGTGATATITIG